MTASCISLWIVRSFSEYLIYRAPLGNCLFDVQVVEFQPVDTVKYYFTGAFQVFCTRKRNSHLKLIHTPISKCQPATLRKKNSFTPPFSAYCLHFSRTHHDCFFRRGFESVQGQFLLGNITEKEFYFWFTCSTAIHLSQHSSLNIASEVALSTTEYGILRFLQYKDNKKFLLFAQLVWVLKMYFFYEILIVLCHCDILFYSIFTFVSISPFQQLS